MAQRNLVLIGKGQHAKSPKGSARSDLRGFYGRPAAPVELNDQQFRFMVLRPDLYDMSIDKLIETAEWSDGEGKSINQFPTLTGTLGLRKPHPDDERLDDRIHDGHVVKCDVFWNGRWTELWQMRIQDIDEDLDGSWTFQMQDDIKLIAQSRDTFRYRRGKKQHKRGWRCHEIARHVARKYRIPLGRIAKGKTWIKNLHDTDTSPLDIIRRAYAHEQRETGRIFTIVWRNGRLNIEPLRRNPVLYTLRDQITSAQLSKRRKAHFATAITARASVKKKGRKAKKLVHREVSEPGVKRYGYIHRPIRLRNVDSQGELVRRSKRELAKRLGHVPEINELTHPGIAFLRRGDAIQLDLPEPSYETHTGIVFITSAQYRLAAGDFSMSLNVGLKDTLTPARKRALKDAKKRQEKRKKKD